MKIKEFINPLKTVLNLGSAQVTAWRNLIACLTDGGDDWADDVSSKMSDGQITKILNGKRNISHDYASKIISANYTPSLLSDSIDKLDITVKKALAKEFQVFDKEVTEENVGEWCANKFTSFLIEPLKRDDPVREIAEIKVRQANIQRKLEHLKMSLVLETEGICPQIGCNNSLLIRDDANQVTDSYEIVIIDSKRAADDEENLIAMCTSCAAQYSGLNVESVNSLKKIKNQLVRRRYNLQLLSPEEIEDEIKQVIIKIQSIEEFPEPYDEKIDGPLRVKEKIKDDTMLRLDIQSNVRNWFKFVHVTLQNLDYSNNIQFQDVKDIMHTQYRKLARAGLSQREIIDSLTEYLHQTTKEPKRPCEIVISYFVQDCEVLDATT